NDRLGFRRNGAPERIRDRSVRAHTTDSTSLPYKMFGPVNAYEKGFDDAGFPRRRGYHSQDRAAHLEHAITTIFLTHVYALCQVPISRFFKVSYLGWSVPGDRRVLRPTATSAGSSDTGMARVGFRPCSVCLSTSTHERLRRGFRGAWFPPRGRCP